MEAVLFQRCHDCLCVHTAVAGVLPRLLQQAHRVSEATRGMALLLLLLLMVGHGQILSKAGQFPGHYTPCSLLCMLHGLLCCCFNVADSLLKCLLCCAAAVGVGCQWGTWLPG
jgi:hypothetical protein